MSDKNDAVSRAGHALFLEAVRLCKTPHESTLALAIALGTVFTNAEHEGGDDEPERYADSIAKAVILLIRESPNYRRQL